MEYHGQLCIPKQCGNTPLIVSFQNWEFISRFPNYLPLDTWWLNSSGWFIESVITNSSPLVLMQCNQKWEASVVLRKEKAYLKCNSLILKVFHKLRILALWYLLSFSNCAFLLKNFLRFLHWLKLGFHRGNPWVLAKLRLFFG